MEYDDITLMMYADGELDHHASLRLEKELPSNPDLQKRLQVFTQTRSALLEMEKHSSVPNHIERLIDRLDRPKEQKSVWWRNVFETLWGHPSLALAASVAFGLVVGAKGMQSVMTASDVPGIDLPVKSYQSVKSKKAPINETSSKVLQTGILKLIGSLDSSPDATSIKFTLNGVDQTINIVSAFKNSEGQQCKLAQLQGAYLVACANQKGRWSVRRSK